MQEGFPGGAQCSRCCLSGGVGSRAELRCSWEAAGGAFEGAGDLRQAEGLLEQQKWVDAMFAAP